MDHSAHAVLMMTTAVFVLAGGVIVLGLAWRRSYRHEQSGVVLGAMSARQVAASYAVVPIGGLLGLVVLAVIAPLLR